MTKSIGGVGFLAGLKGYNALGLATQFSVTIDLIVAEPTDAQSVERALLAAMLSEGFPAGMAIVKSTAVLPK